MLSAASPLISSTKPAEPVANAAGACLRVLEVRQQTLTTPIRAPMRRSSISGTAQRCRWRRLCNVEREWKAMLFKILYADGWVVSSRWRRAVSIRAWIVSVIRKEMGSLAMLGLNVRLQRHRSSSQGRWIVERREIEGMVAESCFL